VGEYKKEIMKNDTKEVFIEPKTRRIPHEHSSGNISGTLQKTVWALEHDIPSEAAEESGASIHICGTL
jgi:hypothetical protein